MAPPKGPTLRVPFQRPSPWSHPRVPPQGPTPGSHHRLLGPKSHPRALVPLFQYASSEILAFLRPWDYYWKCEFDTDVKIENYYHHDGEQLGFHKKVLIKTQGKKKDVLVIFALQERKKFNLFDKNCTQENVKSHIQHEDSWLRWIANEQVNFK